MNESFEKWWATVPAEYTDVVSEDVARSAHTAGLLRAAEIAEKRYNYAPLVDEETCEEIAAEIRKEAGDGSST